MQRMTFFLAKYFLLIPENLLVLKGLAIQRFRKNISNSPIDQFRFYLFGLIW